MGSIFKRPLDCIKALTFPRSLKKESNNRIIMNDNPLKVEVEQPQYFIDMDVEGQLLGVFWVLTIGVMPDNEVYEHSYGSRLKKNLINEETENTTFSPYLFKPYFEQYESWRDIGLKYAENCLDKKQDALILTMDLKRYYYSVNFSEKQFEDFLSSYKEKQECDSDLEESYIRAIDRVNQYVYKVMERFSSYIPDYNTVFLPIEFFPSNILSNWYLNEFDSAISDRWNLVYYGRYVDDIIVVIKIEKNSYIHRMAKENKLTQETVIEFFLCNCILDKNGKCDKNISLLLAYKEMDEGNDKNGSDEKTYYKINSSVLNDEKANITIQNDKVKVFYFKSDNSKAIISCFRNEITKNKSEFRHLPADEAGLQSSNYSEIFELNISDTVNKFCGIDGISINKYNLSKFLGKYLRIGGLINDRKESKFERDILKIFDNQAIIENYILWERIIEILVINNNFNLAYQFIEKILTSIKNTKYKQKIGLKKIKKL